MNREDRFQLVDRSLDPDHHNPATQRRRLQARRLPESWQNFERSARHFKLERGLETAINMALSVGAPLLLTGEPGTGKTQVAYFIGWYFGIRVFGYQVRSDATAEDIKYDFDAVAYLREAQHSDNDKRRPREDFLRPRALWQAYLDEGESVLLIDEIDKAPRDFPNDLLQELDKHQFQHPFKDEIITPRCGRPPIVVVTSNAERRLPDAFLRRCIFHHIELNKDLIRTIVQARLGDFPHLTPKTIEAACQCFWQVRKLELRKHPSTGEFLVWLSILSASGAHAEDLDRPLKDLPALNALIKNREDFRLL